MVLCTLGLHLQGVQKRADGDLFRVLEQRDPNRGLGIARQDLDHVGTVFILTGSNQEVRGHKILLDFGSAILGEVIA